MVSGHTYPENVFLKKFQDMATPIPYPEKIFRKTFQDMGLPDMVSGIAHILKTIS